MKAKLLMGTSNNGFADANFVRAAKIFNTHTGNRNSAPAWRVALRSAASAAGRFVTRSQYAGALLFSSFAPPVVRAAPAPVAPAPAPVYLTQFMNPSFVPAPRVEVMVAAAVAPVVEIAPEVAPVVKRPTLKLAALKAVPVVVAAPVLSKAFATARVTAAAAQVAAAPEKKRSVLKLKHSVAAKAVATNDAVPAAVPARAKLTLSAPVKVVRGAAVNLTRRSSSDDFAAAFKAELQLAEARGDITVPVREKSRATDQKVWSELTAAFREEMQAVTAPAAPAVVVRSQLAQPKQMAQPKNVFNMMVAGVPSAAQPAAMVVARKAVGMAA